MDDELYGRVRGFLAAMEALNNHHGVGEFVGFLFERLPSEGSLKESLSRFVREGPYGSAVWAARARLVLTPLPDWRPAVRLAANALLTFLIPGPFSPPQSPAGAGGRAHSAEFLGLLDSVFGGVEPAVFSVEWRNQQGKEMGGWIAHVQAYEFVFETANGERFLLALGHDD
jgi:hypothetical protein